MKNDLLSDIVSTLKLQSEVYFETDFRGGFAVQIPQARRHIRLHLIHRGACWIRVPDTPPCQLGEGDLAIIPNGIEQTISASADSKPVSLQSLLDNGALLNGVLSQGAGGGATRMLCGFCHFDEEIDHPVLTNLPSLMIIRPSDLGAEPWASATLRLLELEGDMKAPGTTEILSRLLEVIFIQAIRRMVPTHNEPRIGFMAALENPRLSPALHAIHEEPSRPWTIEGLARLSGMSRGRFADKFKQALGTSPMQYLTQWRLMTARRLLRDTNLDMADVAERCGYKSVPSFSRRFKTCFGLGPGAFRRSNGRL